MSTERTDTRFALSAWLRRLGAVTFLGAGALFLFEGVADAGALRRELLWTGVTLALSFFGIFVARAARDAAGARVLLGLAAATIPTHFAQVGGQLWSWRVEGTESLEGVVLGGALLVLLAPPLSIGVSALVRGRGALLTSLLFVLSCPLLLTTRNGDAIAACVVVEVFALLALELMVFRNDPRMKTFEGLSARAMLLVPPAILLLRNAFHPSTSAWVAALFVAPSIVLLALPHLTSWRGSLSRALQAASVVGLALGVVVFCGSAPWVGLVLSVVGLLGTKACVDEPRILAQLGLAAFVVSVAVVSVAPDARNAALIVPVSILHFLAAHRLRSLPHLIVTLVATLAGVAGQLAPFIRFPLHDRWILVAAAGMALLLLATLVERYRGRVDRIVSDLESQFRVGATPPTPSAPESPVVTDAPAAAEIYR